ncbi:AAA family ATPase [uncultured Prevotella sp.]|uniref:AAA family ATPase n=1 Tax=uncultured Prevotella sp. TaxID=159272 RepID=UPI00342267B0
MKRIIYQQLLDWKEKRNGEVALLIEGARRIGKSYIVEEFAKNEYELYILIDFNKAPQMVRDRQISLDVVLINTKHTNGVILAKATGI